MPTWEEMLSEAVRIPKELESVSARVLMIDRDLAKHYLGSNKSNYRKMSRSHVETITRDIKKGLWKFSNASIAFDRNGQLVDGQHRLLAIALSGITTPVLVVKGMPDESANNPSIDTGMRRRAHDHLKNNGTVNGREVASTVRKICGLLLENIDALDRCVTDAAVVEIVSCNPDIERCVRKMMPVKRICPVSIAATWFWVAVQEDEHLAHQFADSFIGDRECTNLDASVKLREILMLEKASSRHLTMRRQLSLFFSAWERKKLNAQVKGLRELKQIKIPRFVRDRIIEMRKPKTELN